MILLIADGGFGGMPCADDFLVMCSGVSMVGTSLDLDLELGGSLGGLD